MTFVLQFNVQNLNIGYRTKLDIAHCFQKLDFLMTGMDLSPYN